MAESSDESRPQVQSSSSEPGRFSDSTFRRIGALAIFLFVVIGGSFVYQKLTGVYHLATVQPGVLYRDGVRSIGELERTVARVQPKTVVCLVDEREVSDPSKPQFKQEFDFLGKQGINLERIPVKLGDTPTTQDVQKFLNIASNPKNQPVLVHCAQGVRRTGMMVAAFQESVMGYDKERAKAEIMTFGHSDDTTSDIRKFIDRYDPKARTVSDDLK